MELSFEYFDKSGYFRNLNNSEKELIFKKILEGVSLNFDFDNLKNTFNLTNEEIAVVLIFRAFWSFKDKNKIELFETLDLLKFYYSVNSNFRFQIIPKELSRFFDVEVHLFQVICEEYINTLL